MKTKFKKYKEYCKQIDEIANKDLNSYMSYIWWECEYEEAYYKENSWREEPHYEYDKNGFCVRPLTLNELRKRKLNNIV